MAKKGKAQIWIEYAVAKTVLLVLGFLPRRAAVWLGIAIARIGYRLLGGLRRTGLRNLEIAFPEKSESERRKILKGSFENLGRTLGEASHLRNATPEYLREIADFDLDEPTRELYKSIKDSGRGVLVTTGHFGNWELLVLAFAAFYEPMSYLARPIDNPLIEEMTLAIRTQFGNRPINKSNSAQVAIGILKDGGFLGALSDVNAHPKEGVFVPFFGIPACTSVGPALIAIRSGALIFPAFCAWDRSTGRFKFVHGRQIEPANTGDRKADIAATTAAYTAEIEKVIRRYPDQWLWIHKRWKTRPPGEEGFY